MTPESEALWRELLKRAGPSSAVPVVDAVQCCASAGIASAAVDAALADLSIVGAMALLNEDELRKMGSGKRFPGDFVCWNWRGSTRFLRIVDPDYLRQLILAQTEALRREDLSQHIQQRVLEGFLAAADMTPDPDVASTTTQLVNPNIDEALRQSIVARTLAMIRETSVNETFKETAARLLNDLDAIRERRRLIAVELSRLSAIPYPRWASNESATEYRREQIPKAVQQDVWRRDQGRCVECGSKENLEFDHIIPVSKGGATTTRNLQLLCEPCNRRKNNRI